MGGGEVFFKIGAVDGNAATTFTDDVADFPYLDSKSGAASMQSILLPTDNLIPYSWFDDCAFTNFPVGTDNGKTIVYLVWI